MGFAGASSIVIALAIGLWLCYAVPIWLRHHNELAVERDAVRLQRTIRVLAMTSDAPREPEREGDASGRSRGRGREANGEQGVGPAGGRRAAVAGSAPSRRGRLLCTIVLAAGLLAAAAGMPLAAGGAWWLLTAGVAAMGLAVAMLIQLNRVAARRRAVRAVAAVEPASPARDRIAPALPADLLGSAALEREAGREQIDAEPAAAQADPAAWTPTRVPAPLYLARDAQPEPDPDGPGGVRREEPRDPMAELLAAVRRSEQAIRDAHRERGVATFGAVDAITVASSEPLLGEIASASAPPAAASESAAESSAPSGERSPWAAMGRLDDLPGDYEDITEILRRRRAG